MRETARWQDKVEMHLDNRQLYFLFFGTAVAACLVFAVGVLVGKRLEAGARAAGAPADPLAALDQLDTTGLGRMAMRVDEPGARPAGRPGAEQAQVRTTSGRTPAPRDPQAASRTPHDRAAREPGQGHDAGLTFHRALLDPKAKQASDPLTERGRPARTAGVAPTAREKRVAGRAEEAADERQERDGDRYIVQLRPVPSQAEAEALVRKLSASGYRPYLVASNAAGKGPMYRVRLGEFHSRRAAETAKAEFESREKTTAFVARLR